MSLIRTLAALAALTAFILAAPSPAHAQEQRFRVSFAPAVATPVGGAELALGGTFGYRFSERFWFEGDLTWLDAGGGFGDFGSNPIPFPFEFGGRFTNAAGIADVIRTGRGAVGGGLPIGGIQLPGFPITGIGSISDLGGLRASIDGSTMVGTLGVRYELPVQGERFHPYVAGGLGINNTDREFRLEATRFTPVIGESSSHTGYAFNAGAGASVRLAGQLWADVDARYLRLSLDRDIMRVGGGVSIRF
jgi:opacity protein-like surface antigen